MIEESKVCTCCKQTKPIEEFKWRNKKMGERTNLCKKCSNEKNIKYAKKRKKTTKRIELSFTEEEMALIKEHALENNTTTGRYIKKLALDKKIGKEIIWKDIEKYGEIKTMLSMFTNQVKRVGNNVNQLAYAYNSTGEINQTGISNLPAYMEYVVKMLNQLEELIQDGIV